MTVANEIHIPAGEPVELTLTSADVIHSFWVPELHGKLDMLPDGPNTLVLEADEPGEYLGACAEFCGLQHAGMNFLVIAQPRAEFDAWLAAQREPAEEPAGEPPVGAASVFAAEGCAGCHEVGGRTDGEWTAQAGPDLTHVGSRRTMAADTIANTAEQMTEWLRDPDEVKEGTTMPTPELTDERDRASSSPTSRGSSEHQAGPVSTETDEPAERRAGRPVVHADRRPGAGDRAQARRDVGRSAGPVGKLMAVQNDAIGKRLLLTGFFFLLLGGSVDSLVMRLQLAVPGERPHQPRALQRAVHQPRLGDDVPGDPADHRGLRDPAAAVPARHPRDAVPRLGAYSFFTFLMGGLFYYSEHAVPARPRRRVVRLHPAQPAASSRRT